MQASDNSKQPQCAFVFVLAALWLLAGSPCSAVAGESSEARGAALVAAAIARTQVQVRYDGAYRPIAYPGGDVPDHIGVCTDLVIRAYRTIGLDLQQAVHEDMSASFSSYPSTRIWGLRAPDAHIDHRRVPNLQVFLARSGANLPVTDRGEDYRPGDLVTWMLPGNLPHIGIVSDRPTGEGTPTVRQIVHNIGAGPVVSDILFKYPITGHYRFLPESPGFLQGTEP